MFSLKRKFRKYLNSINRNLKFIFIFSLILFLINLWNKNPRDELFKINQILKIQNDFNVNISDYLQRFNDYKSIKNKQKQLDDTKFKYIKIVNKNSRSNLNKSEYLIFEYTKFFDSTKNCQHENRLENIYFKECPYKNCRFTCDQNELEKSDALLFHESDMKNELKKDKTYIETISKKHRKNPEQIYILWNDEPNEVLESFDSIEFNWTLSYRYDAEVSDCSYGCYHKIQHKNAKNRLGSREILFQNLKKEFNSRKNEAVGLISNCKPKFRTKFTSLLRRYFNVKIYGLCSTMIYWNLSNENIFGKIISGIFGLYDSIFSAGSCVRNSAYTKCEAEFLLNSKFFLSFESKNCTNYITEKFWRILR